jgi:hypothetical protein
MGASGEKIKNIETSTIPANQVKWHHPQAEYFRLFRVSVVYDDARNLIDAQEETRTTVDVGSVEDAKANGAREDQSGFGGQGSQACRRGFNAEIHQTTSQRSAIQLSNDNLDEVA